MEKKIKHLELIESIISRMAKNSFTLKGWTITLITAIFALASKNESSKYLIIAYLPVISFWILDSFYLQLERKYKILYSNVIEKSESEIDFNLNTRIIEIPTSYKNRTKLIYCLFSISELLFYFPVVLGLTFILNKLGIFVSLIQS